MSKVVLVHGVPDTADLWSPMRAELARDDVVALALPGFGVPLPPGFAARDDDYAAWIVAQLERIGAPELARRERKQRRRSRRSKASTR